MHPSHYMQSSQPQEILAKNAHRPFPLPKLPWVMTQTWNRALFAHWPLATSTLQDYIPRPLTLDTFDGWAWLGIIPFEMSGIRLRGLPPIPGTTSFPELNVRTYVTYEDKPGVYFFSLDATHRLAVFLARSFFSLPYYHAHIQCSKKGERVYYQSVRIQKQALPAQFCASYQPSSAIFYAEKGSLEHWLTERYSLYTSSKRYLYRGDIHHFPWPLQRAEAEIVANNMVSLPEVDVSGDPLLHYAEQIAVLIWPFVRVSRV